jgi:uncharacterized membrane protein (DUF441 family)
MNTTLLVEQLTVAILSSAIAIPTVQRFKNFLPSDKAVELFSILVAFLVGTGFAIYYAQFEIISSLIVGGFSVIGAESIYKLLGEKVKAYTGKPIGIELQEEENSESVG